MGLFGTLISVFAVFVVDNAEVNPLLTQAEGFHTVWLKLSVILGAGATVALVVAGIGLLLMKRWARTLSLIYAVYTVVSVVVGSAIPSPTSCPTATSQSTRSSTSSTANLPR